MADEIRIGKVCALYPERLTVRVEFDDTGLVSNELKVKVASAEEFQVYILPSIGAQVECTMQSNGQEEGCISGGFYSEANPPPFADADIIGFKCGDSLLTFRKSTGKLTIVAGGNLEITGNIVVHGDVIANGVSLTTHVHGGVESGGSKTGGPS